MRPKNDRPPFPSAVSPVPRKRFRIEKLEERIAPRKKKGGGVIATVGGTSASSAGSY